MTDKKGATVVTQTEKETPSTPMKPQPPPPPDDVKLTVHLQESKDPEELCGKSGRNG